MKTLTAVLFTGGESRRMGRDKATLVWNGEPLWSRQLRTLKILQPDKILISARKRPDWCPADIETILDEPPSRGPFSGLAVALNAAQTSHVLALAIDLPEMTPAHLQMLWSLARPGAGVVPQKGDYFEPLCAIYPAEAAAAAQQALAQEMTSLQQFIQTLAGRKEILFFTISKPQNLIYRNLNTPLD